MLQLITVETWMGFIELSDTMIILFYREMAKYGNIILKKGLALWITTI